MRDNRILIVAGGEPLGLHAQSVLQQRGRESDVENSEHLSRSQLIVLLEGKVHRYSAVLFLHTLSYKFSEYHDRANDLEIAPIVGLIKDLRSAQISVGVTDIEEYLDQRIVGALRDGIPFVLGSFDVNTTVDRLLNSMPSLNRSQPRQQGMSP
jgi:hypothetical protein